MIDRIDTMGAVKREVASVLDGVGRAKSSPERRNGPQYSHADSLCMLELSADLHRVTRIVEDGEPVQYSNEDSCLVAYRLSDKLDGNLMLLQVRSL
jgi:hypothetical protein